MTATNPPAGWHPDPNDPRFVRYWDGTRWTEHTAPNPHAAPQQNVAPAAGPTSHEAAAAPGAASAPAHQTGPGFPELPNQARTGALGSKRALASELEELRALVGSFGYAEREALTAELERMRAEHAALSSELAELRTEVVQTREDRILQEVGVYDYHHQLQDAVAYKVRISSLREQIREMSKKDGGAVQATTDWTVNGSKTQGRKMVREFSKLLLRAYNGEADVLVNKMRPYKLEAAVDRLTKARNTVSRLGQTMQIRISEPYHQLRIEELRLTADYLAKKEEEKEADREHKAQLREEAKARKEFEQEKARLLKEQTHYSNLLDRLRTGNASPDELANAEKKLAEIGEAIHGVEEHEANIRAGYVYVISNVGAFGPEIVKVGMTRRLEPMDRVRELGDASVPFRFDVHALIFSDDAVALERRLHDQLGDRRMNLVNTRREFFYASPGEVRDLLVASDDSALVEFVEEFEADEWHQSENQRRHTQATTT